MRRGLTLWLGLAAITALLGVFAGRELKGGGPEAFAFDLRAPSYAAADALAGHSRAGFTGFAETGGLDGSTIVAGRVTAVGPDTITVATAAGSSAIRLTGEQKLRVLQPIPGALTAGMTLVILKKPGSSEAQAVLAVIDR